MDVQILGADGPIVWLPSFGDEGANVWAACQEMELAGFRLAVVETPDWNDALSPWPAPAVYQKMPPFGGHADRTREALTARIAKEDAPWHAVAGYSLAGLFALYALYRTGCFACAASVSGSLWYPQFMDLVRTDTMPRRPDAVYLSLGDREHLTRNAAMATVHEETAAMHAHLQGLGIPTVFVEEPGGHFQDPAGRTARGIAWLLANVPHPKGDDLS